MKAKITLGLSALIIVLVPVLITTVSAKARGGPRGSSWAPTIAGGSYMVENNWMILQSDSGYDNQGPNTIVNAFNKFLTGWPDGMWYGEYEYISIDDGATWTWLSLANGFTRTLTENVPNQDYTITFNTAGTALAILTITKRVIISVPTGPASLIYTIDGPTGIGPVRLYYSPDFCDWETTGNRWDRIYLADWAQVMTSGWYWTNGLWVDTLGSGSWGLFTSEPASYYAGYWWRALYGAGQYPWTTDEDIHIWDLGIGLIIEFGILQSPVSKGIGHPDDPQTGAPQEPGWPGPPGEPEQPQTVGGAMSPIDKFGLLTPYIGLVSTLTVATVATAIYVKRVKPGKEKP